MADDRPQIDSEEIATRISEEILAVHEESYGVGAQQITTDVLEELVVVMIEVELTPAERTLLDAGHDRAVKDTREAFQAAIGATFSAIVERATGRRVNAFVSHFNVDPLFAVEMFRLDPPSRYATS